jgi:hypothetical protein
MMGNSFWDDMSIDAYEKQLEIDRMARDLVDHWGKELSENDLLKLKAYKDGGNDPIESAFAKSALDYYLTQNYNPAFIHADMYGKSSSKRWWQIWKR